MRNSLSKMQYLLFALLLVAFTGCGTSQLAGTGDNTAGKSAVTAKVVIAKNSAKTVAYTSADVATIKATVTGTGLDGNAIPVVRGTGTVANGISVTGIYPGKVTVSVAALDANGATLYEGFALNVEVNPNATSDAGTIVLREPLTKEQDKACVTCHETTIDKKYGGQNLVANFKQSGHYTNSGSSLSDKYTGVVGTGCAGCHGPKHNDLNPAASGRCFECHGSTLDDNHTAGANKYLNAGNTNCGTCHQPHRTTDATCIGCHSIAQNAGEGFVQDNNGVRAITGEFAKWSHHVTGVKLNDAHCAACHLEGKEEGGSIKVDATKHMVDARVHLRDTTNNIDEDFAWDPAAPNHTGMDTFCLSCHDSNGAVSPQSAAIQSYINTTPGVKAPGKTASPTNPFGDTISNRYDKMLRPAVVDVDGQFNTGNESHHAVKGPKYSGRTRNAGSRQIAHPETFANNSSADLWGKRSTIYDNKDLKTGLALPYEAFNSLYTPLANAGGESYPRTGSASLGDDSTLHCGDCHTVGQWKPGVATNAKGELNTVAIGAHGSNNEYLLRNSTGTDERHSQKAWTKNSAGNYIFANENTAALVCFNCHTYQRYGSLSHAGESVEHCNDFANTLTFKGYTTGTATDGTQFESRIEGTIAQHSSVDAFAPGFPLNAANRPAFGELSFDNGGNIFGIQCANCHNSGLNNGYGGIHGSKVNTYLDGMGNTNATRRFLPGLGNVKFVPGTLGGVTGGSTVGPVTNGSLVYTYTTGGVVNDTNWEQSSMSQQASGATQGQSGAGCYTLFPDGEGKPGSDLTVPVSVDGGATATSKAFGTWGACEDHGSAVGKGDHGAQKKINRPVTY